jgi:hypothetical protein
MLFLKYLLLSAGIAMFVIAAGILIYDTRSRAACSVWSLHRQGPAFTSAAPAGQWRISAALVMLAWAPLVVLAGFAIGSCS